MLTLYAILNFSRLESQTSPSIAGKTIGDFVNLLVPYFFLVAGILLLLFLIFSGFSYMLSRGDPKATSAAKGKITSALVGFFIVFFAYFIVRFIALFFNIQPILNVFQ